jgi:hypothetical protein
VVGPRPIQIKSRQGRKNLSLGTKIRTLAHRFSLTPGFSRGNERPSKNYPERSEASPPTNQEKKYSPPHPPCHSPNSAFRIPHSALKT